jgi:hypothetical protein
MLVVMGASFVVTGLVIIALAIGGDLGKAIHSRPANPPMIHQVAWITRLSRTGERRTAG